MPPRRWASLSVIFGGQFVPESREDGRTYEGLRNGRGAPPWARDVVCVLLAGRVVNERLGLGRAGCAFDEEKCWRVADAACRGNRADGFELVADEFARASGLVDKYCAQIEVVAATLAERGSLDEGAISSRSVAIFSLSRVVLAPGTVGPRRSAISSCDR